MAGLKIEPDKKYRRLLHACRHFENDISLRLLMGIGKRVTVDFRKMLLSGRYLDFVNYSKEGKSELKSSKGNKRMITLKVPGKRKDKAIIASFPMNLFNKSRRGYRDRPIYRALLTKVLRNKAESKVAGYGEFYAEKIVKEFN